MTNINWNGDAESAPFKSRFDDESGNLILAETDTGTGLFEWDGSAWQFRGPVEMNGEDVSGIGSLTATSGNFDSVTTGEASIAETVGVMHSTVGTQDIPHDTFTQVAYDTVSDEDSAVVSMDTTNDQIVIQEAGTYRIESTIRWSNDANWSQGDRAEVWLRGDIDEMRIREPAHGGWTDDAKSMTTSRTYELSANDTIRTDVRQRSGSTIPVAHSALESNKLEVVRVG